MASYQYIDDLYIDFYVKAQSHGLYMNDKESAAADNFYNLLFNGEPITRAQSHYIIRILKNHRNFIDEIKLDSSMIDSPIFKNEFRIKDLSRRIDIEVDEHKDVWIVVKQPYEYKDRFDESCLKTKKIPHSKIKWDNEQKIKKYLFDTVNCIMIKEFAEKHRYEISKNFLDLIDQIETVWNEQEKFLKKCRISNGVVELINASESADRYFSENKKDSISNDLLLAKSIGHPLDSIHHTTTVEKISASLSKIFWIKDIDKLITLIADTDSKVCLLINREQMGSWLLEFIDRCDKNNISRSEIKIGFRTSNQEKPDFNQWIKENGHGGDLEQGKILIFKEKPPKWLIEKPGYVKIVVITESFMPSSMMIQDWISNQTCVIFLGNVKPTSFREKEIVLL